MQVNRDRAEQHFGAALQTDFDDAVQVGFEMPVHVLEPRISSRHAALGEHRHAAPFGPGRCYRSFPERSEELADAGFPSGDVGANQGGNGIGPSRTPCRDRMVRALRCFLGRGTRSPSRTRLIPGSGTELRES